MTRPASDVQACLRGLRAAIRDLGQSRKRLLARLAAGGMSDREATAAETELRRVAAARVDLQERLAETELRILEREAVERLTESRLQGEIEPPHYNPDDDGGDR